MKKLLFIFAFLASFLIGQAATVTINPGDGYTSESTTITKGIVKLTFKTAPKVYNPLRVYAGNETTIDLTSNNPITEIKITCTDASYGFKNEVSVSKGTLQKASDNKSATITNSGGNLNGVVLSNKSQIRITEIVITYDENMGEDPEPTTCEAPVFNYPEGDIVAGTPVTVSCPTDEAKISSFTINGDEVAAAIGKETHTFPVNEDMEVKVIYELSDGSAKSKEGAIMYLIYCEKAEFSVPSGPVEAGTSVTISCPTKRATIFDLQINDETIKDAEGEATYPFTVVVDPTTVKVTYVWEDEETFSQEATATYTVIKPTCALPEFTVPSGTVEPGTPVTISCPTTGATIFDLEINNEAISEAEGQAKYTFTVDTDMTVKVTYILDDDETVSDEATATYTVIKPTCADPVFSVASGAVEYGREVTVSCPTAGAKIAELDINDEAVDAAEGQAEYTFTVDKEMTVSVYYIHPDGTTTSDVATATYTVIKPTCADPVFSVASGAVEYGREVTVSCPTAGAKIAELDINDVAVDAAEGQAEYTFTVDKDMTVSVFYIHPDGETMSNVIEAKYTVKADGGTIIVKDVITADDLKATSTTYQGFSNVKGKSGAVYLGKTANDGGNIVIRTTNYDCGIVTDVSGGKVKSITINFASKNNSERTVEVYGKHSAYSSAADLFDPTKQGENIGSLTTPGKVVSTASLALEKDKQYEYIGFCSKGSAIYISSIEIEWEQEIDTTCAAPMFNPAFGEVKAETAVEVTCATKGAKLNLLIKKGDEVVVEEPAAEFPIIFTVSEPVSVEAYTYTADDESDKSETVKGEYTIAAPVEGVQYQLVESEDDLTLGDEYIMVYASGNPGGVMGPRTGTNKFYNAVTGLNIINNTITVTPDNNVLPFIIEEGTNSDTYAFKASTGYITCTSDENNNLGSSEDKVANANLAFSWTGSEVSMVWANNSNSNKNKFQYNATSPRFSNYKTGSQKDCSLFKRVKAIPETCEAPVFTPALNGEEALAPGTNVTVTCPTDGAKLYIKVVGYGTNIEVKAAKMPYKFKVNEDVVVEAYAYFNDDVKSETVTGSYTVNTTVEGTFAYVEDFAGLNVGDQVVFVSNFGVASPVSMSSEQVDDDTVFPDAKEVTLSEDKSEITSELTNKTIFTIAGIRKDDAGREMYAFVSNVASLEPLYLQYAGDKFLNIDKLTTDSKYHFTAIEKEGYPNQFYIPETLNTEDKRLIRANGTVDWRAYLEGQSYDGGKYTRVYKKIEEVEQAATPTFSVESGDVTEGTSVTIKSTTKGARLSVKVGENTFETTTSSYTFNVTSEVTVTATAYLVDASGKKIVASESQPAEASYSIRTLPVFTLATDIEPGYDYIIVGKSSNKYGLMGGLSGKYIAEVEVAGNAEMNDGKFIITSDNVARVRFEPAEKGKYYVHYKQGETDGYLTTVYNNSTSSKNEVAIAADKETAESANVSVGANGRGTIKYDVNAYTSGELGHNGSASPHRFTFYKNAENYDIYLYKCTEGTSPVTYYRSRTILEDVDYVIVGATGAGHYVMTGYDSDAKNFGSTHEKSNGDVTMLGGGYHLTVADKNVAVVNFVKKEAGVMRAEGETAPATEWAMMLKDGQHIVRGADGEAALSDEADHVTYKIVEDKDGYMAYLVHGDGQKFQFDGTGFSSSSESSEAATPLYIYATKVPVEGDAMKFADEASNSVTLTTGFDASRDPIKHTFNAVEMPKGKDDFFYIFYDGLATLDDAKNMSDDELSWRYKYNDSDWFKAEAADQEQTSKVAMHVEVEMLGGADGENLSYKKANPDVPGDWTSNDYIKYNGVNQVYIADTDQPYIKVPAISKYSIVTATATGDNATHIGDAAAAQRVYVRADDNGTTSIEAIDFDSTEETRYYNLQGVRVYNPGSGIYIRVQGRTATKVNIVR